MPTIKSSDDLRNNYNEISAFCHNYPEPVFDRDFPSFKERLYVLFFILFVKQILHALNADCQG